MNRPERKKLNGISKHIAGYKYAMRGVGLAFRHEPAMRFHLAAAAGVVLANGLLGVSRTEWLITLMLIGLAWMAEVFNTALERLADRVTRDHDPLIGQAKDLAAGAVIIICFFAAVCALVIYLPYLL